MPGSGEVMESGKQWSNPLVIGLDYGTESVRAVLVCAVNGEEVASAESRYALYATGRFCDPKCEQYRVHPQDYLDSAKEVLHALLSDVDQSTVSRVVGLCTTTTGSTPCFVDKKCNPLAMCDTFTTNPNAMFMLWKDHVSVNEAAEINEAAHKNDPDYTSFCGGTYSSEWFWSKALHVLKHDPEVAAAAYGVVECCEWLPAHLCGVTDFDKLVRSQCAAGHKAMWNVKWGGYPPADFFAQIHPLLGELRSRMTNDVCTTDRPVGVISPYFADIFGLPRNVVVAGGAIDAHMGAIGAGIAPFSLVRVMGTSTCDMIVLDPSTEHIGHNGCVRGICGQADGSIIPGMIGLEAGQSAYGDVFAWFYRLIATPVRDVLLASSEIGLETAQKVELVLHANLLSHLGTQAALVDPSYSTVLALDWLNGRRTPFANQNLKAAIHGLTLGSDAPAVFRALVEATAFGSRAIVEQFRREGVLIDDVMAVGGLAKKAPFVVQILANVLNVPIKVCKSSQVCALGAAIAAATAAGVYKTIPAAQRQMASGLSTVYMPDEKEVGVYDKLYQRYLVLAKSIETECEGKVMQ